MGLINLSTNLKSLKFGKDRPGGGSSGQPYMKKDIPDKDAPSILDTDFIWRGGLKAPIRAAEDVARMTKYLFDTKSPRGILFVAKQNLLSRTAVSTENSIGPSYGNGSVNGGIYTPLSTLAQVGVGWTGTHLNKQGIDPSSPMTGVLSNGLFDKFGLNRYEKVVWNKNKKELNTTTPINQGLLNTTTQVISPPLIPGLNPFAQTGQLTPTEQTQTEIENFNNRLLLYYSTRINKTQLPYFTDYPGGPGSALGIGRTRIKFATDGDGSPLRTFFNDKRYQAFKPRLSTNVNYNKLLGASVYEKLTEFETGINSSGDFTTFYNPSLLPYSTLSKYNPTSFPLSGSGAYQTYKPRVTEESQTTYKDLINSRLNTIYNRELIATSSFNPTTGQWELTSQLQSIPPYSSYNTLYNDKLETWDEYGGGTKPKPHKNGYLANLDKNAGSYIRDDNKFVNYNNLYNRSGGIAPDFRLTDRKIRGFNDNESFKTNITNQKKQWIKDGVIDKKSIHRIQYSSNESSFMNSNPLNQDDLIPFNIEIIDSTVPAGGTGKVLRFKSYIDSISDSYSAGWKDQKYMGRAESFHKYESFDRDISFDFTIVADNVTNLNIMYNMLNNLAASLAPQYSTAGYMTGNLHKLTIGNYVNKQYGIIKGFTYNIDKETPWDIDKKTPLYIKVSGFKFVPIHNFRPDYNPSGNDNRYIKQL